MEETPDVIPADAKEEDVKRWLTADLVDRCRDVPGGLTPERAKEIVDRHYYSDAILDATEISL